MRNFAELERPLILVECFDITKIKEAEYMLESYAKISEKHTRELERERDRVERLLLNVMPKSVYEEMKDYGTTPPTRVDSAFVLMLDFVNFTEMAVSRDPSSLVAELNDIFFRLRPNCRTVRLRAHQDHRRRICRIGDQFRSDDRLHRRRAEIRL